MAKVSVTITKDSPNSLNCTISPRHFKAKRNDDVIFDFVGVDGVLIDFRNGNSPFGQSRFQPGKVTVKPDAPLKIRFDYTVTWPEPNGAGSGDGSGEIIP